MLDGRVVRELALGQGGVEDLDGGAVEAVGLPGADQAVRVDLDNDLSDDPRAAVSGLGRVGLLVQLDGRVAELVRENDLVVHAVHAERAAVVQGEDPGGLRLCRVDRVGRDDDVVAELGFESLTRRVQRDDVHLCFSPVSVLWNCLLGWLTDCWGTLLKKTPFFFGVCRGFIKIRFLILHKSTYKALFFA